jgi:hypothetical protein
MTTPNKPRYSTALRREFIAANLTRYRYGEKSGYSLRDIAYDIKRHFGLETEVSPSTITNDMRVISESKETHEVSSRAEELLEPENFPEWRSTIFTSPDGGEYETPTHQFAWFWLAISLALKRPLPEWVIEWFAHYDVDLVGVNGWVEKPQILLTLWLLAPPRFGKSDLMRHTCIWLMCRQPNIRIIWRSITLPISKITTSWMKRELESNQKLIAMYGPFQTDGSWSDKEFTIAKRTINLASPTIVALGKGEASQSRDADLIIVDDFIDEKSSESITQVEKDISVLRSQILTRREPWTPVLGIGSHEKAPLGDAYDLMEKHEMERSEEESTAKTLFVKIKAHDYTRCHPGDDLPPEEKHGDWCLLWASMRPFWFLEGQRHDLGDALFEIRYNQDSRRATIVYFSEEVITGDFQVPVFDKELNRYADPVLTVEPRPGILDRTRSYGESPECCRRSANALLRAMGFDPAAGQTRRSAESSLHVVAACKFCLRRYVIDGWHDRVSPETHPDIIDRHAATTRPQRVRVEINAYQKALARDPRLRRSAALRKFIIDEWTTGERKDDPDVGVSLTHGLMQAGLMSFPYKTAIDRERTDDIVRQMRRWPRTPNDQMYSFWLANLSLDVLLAEANQETVTRLPGYDSLPPYLQQSYTIDLSEVRE